MSPRSRYRVSVVSVVALCLALTVVRAQTPPQGGRGGQQAPPVNTGPKAPEVYKNIQVLTDVPADQLDLTMRYISASTGLQCRNCHVQDGTTGEFAYEKDDMRSKQTAREMIKMVDAINAGDFGIRANCATCHAGRNQPAGLRLATMATPDEVTAIAAFAARQGGAGRAAGRGAGRQGGRGQQGPPPPAVDDVLNKYFEAIGGAAAVEKIQSRVVTGSMTDRLGASMAFTVEEKAPDLYRTTMDAAGSKTQTGFDGTTGWTSAEGNASDLAGFPLQYALRMADLSLPMRLKSMASSLQAGRPTRIDGKDTTTLQGTTAPNVIERFYFDAASGLLVRRTITTRTPLGTLPEQIDYSDYRNVSGVQMPFTITRGSWNELDTYKASSIKANTAIADSTFARPKG
jgi:Photosynthetic reaction centre cytochrome C subunit